MHLLQINGNSAPESSNAQYFPLFIFTKQELGLFASSMLNVGILVSFLLNSLTLPIGIIIVKLNKFPQFCPISYLSVSTNRVYVHIPFYNVLFLHTANSIH